MKKRKGAEEEEKETKEQTRSAPDTARSIPDIRGQAGDIDMVVLAFCLVPSKKINKEQTATIMWHFKEMRGFVEELLLHNRTGKGAMHRFGQGHTNSKRSEQVTASQQAAGNSGQENREDRAEATHVRGKGLNDQREDRTVGGKAAEERRHNPPRGKRGGN